MDHQTALSSQAVERYLLDELTSPQREQFEEHFFSCPDCTSALQEYEVFVANARAVFREDAASPKMARQAQPGGWKGVQKWFGATALIPAFAALALAFVLFRNPEQPKPDPAGEQSSWTLATTSTPIAMPSARNSPNPSLLH